MLSTTASLEVRDPVQAGQALHAAPCTLVPVQGSPAPSVQCRAHPSLPVPAAARFQAARRGLLPLRCPSERAGGQLSPSPPCPPQCQPSPQNAPPWHWSWHEAGPCSVPHHVPPELPSCGGAEGSAGDTGTRGALCHQGKPTVLPKMPWQRHPPLWDRQGSRLTVFTRSPQPREAGHAAWPKPELEPVGMYGAPAPEPAPHPHPAGSTWALQGCRDSGTSS